MSIWEEAKQSVRGCVRVIRLDPDALQDFNLTEAGFWRSFYAAVYLLPLYLVHASVAQPKGVSDAKYWLVEAIAYPLSWTLWPLIAFYVCRSANLADRYIAYITVYNWAQILLFGGMMLVTLVSMALFPPALTVNLQIIALLVALAAEALIIRLILDVPWVQAVMIEGVVLVLAIVLDAAKHIVMLGGVPAGGGG